MPDIYMDVDTAVIVPVNIFPLTDDTDFKTREQDITYNQEGMDLVWNFCTTAGATSCTAVTPTTAGNYDWAETVANKGMYCIEIPASGGASINNDTKGVGWFTGLCTGVLSWRGPTIGFRAAALNNALMDGTTIDVNVTAVSGDTTAADNAESFFDGTGYAGTNNVIPTVTTTATATAVTTVNGLANNVITAAAIASDADTEIQAACASALTAAGIPAATITALGTGSALTACLTATGFATPTNITAGTIATVTNLTNAPTAGDLTATMKTSAQTAAAAAITAAALATAANLAAAKTVVDGIVTSIADFADTDDLQAACDAAITANDMIVLLQKWYKNKLVRTDNQNGTITYVAYDDNDSTPVLTWTYTTATGSRAKAT